MAASAKLDSSSANGEGGTRSARGRRAARASGDDRERAILETAERLLEERSLGEISVDDLARGAGISRPTFYFYFPSKDAVVLTLIDRMVEEAEAARGDLLGDLAGDPRSRLRESLQVYYDVFGARRSLLRAGDELRVANAEARELWSRVGEGWVAYVTTGIEAERERGAAPPGVPARDLATALVQMNERVLHATLAGESPAVADENVVDVLLDVWLGAIYGTREPA